MMPTAKKKSAAKTSSADTKAAVDEFMSKLEHPHKSSIAALRKIICGADPAIEEGVKWNVPSFRTREYFATTHLRTKTGIGLVLHFGAKVRDVSAVRIDDPEALLQWLAKDRALINLTDLKETQSRSAAIQAIVRQWLKFV